MRKAFFPPMTAVLIGLLITGCAPQGFKEAFDTAVSLEEKHENEEAYEYYQKALELNPRMTQAHLNLGEIHRSQGRTELAKAQFEKVLKYDPKNQKAHQAIQSLSQN